jgi:hypothetical protein
LRWKSLPERVSLAPYVINHTEEKMHALAAILPVVSAGESMVMIAASSRQAIADVLPFIVDTVDKGRFDVIMGDNPAAVALAVARNLTLLWTSCIGLAAPMLSSSFGMTDELGVTNLMGYLS